MPRQLFYSLDGIVYRFDPRRLEAAYLAADDKTAFADMLGLTRQNLHQWFGGSAPSQELAAMVFRRYPETFVMIGKVQ